MDDTALPIKSMITREILAADLLRMSDWVIVTEPTFIDKSGKAQACLVQDFSREELVKFLLEPGTLYVYQFYKTENGFKMRYFRATDTASAGILSAIEVGQMLLNRGDFMPYRRIKAVIEPEKMQDIRACYGEDEVAKQIGKQILEALATASPATTNLSES